MVRGRACRQGSADAREVTDAESTTDPPSTLPNPDDDSVDAVRPRSRKAAPTRARDRPALDRATAVAQTATSPLDHSTSDGGRARERVTLWLSTIIASISTRDRSETLRR